MAAPLIASGEQVELAAGDLRLVVVTVGGGMRELTRGEWHVLDGYGPDEVAPGASGQPLIPWPNRLADGRYKFDGESYQVPLTEPAKRNAIHGFARWLTWRVDVHERARALLSLVMYPRPGYPFALRLQIEYRISPAGVAVTTTATNAGRRRLPYASGFHPYVSAGTRRVDECLLEIPADSWLPADERQIPTGVEPVEGTRLDFRSARAIGDERLDFAFTHLRRSDDGKARVSLRAPDGSRRVTVWMDGAYGYVMAYTGDTLPDEARRRRSLGVEPMTCAPNAFQTGDGLRVLEPGEQAVSAWGIETGQKTGQKTG